MYRDDLGEGLGENETIKILTRMMLLRSQAPLLLLRVRKCMNESSKCGIEVRCPTRHRERSTSCFQFEEQDSKCCRSKSFQIERTLSLIEKLQFQQGEGAQILSPARRVANLMREHWSRPNLKSHQPSQEMRGTDLLEEL